MSLDRQALYQQARSLLIRARLYRYFGIAFAFTGLAMFIMFYFRNVEGQLLMALTQPSVVAAILFPFLPAFVLSLMASRADKQFFKFMEEHKKK